MVNCIIRFGFWFNRKNRARLFRSAFAACAYTHDVTATQHFAFNYMSVATYKPPSTGDCLIGAAYKKYNVLHKTNNNMARKGAGS